MAIVIAGGSSGNQAEVDSDKHIMMAVKPPAFGSNGCYAKALTSGTIAASLASGSVLWSMRNTSGSIFTLIERIRVAAIVLSTVSSVALSMQLFFATTFTTDYTTNTSAGTLTGRNAKRRTSHATPTLGSMLICTTTGMTGATSTLDTDPIATLAGGSPTTTVGANMLPVGMTLWDMDNGNSHPLILAQNEGLVIKNPATGPTGTFALTVSVDWMEVTSY